MAQDDLIFINVRFAGEARCCTDICIESRFKVSTMTSTLTLIVALLSISPGRLAADGEPPPAPVYAASVVCGHDHLTGEALDRAPRLVVHVVDWAGEPLPSAHISIRGSAASLERNCESGPDGRCVFVDLEPPEVSLRAGLEGFVLAEATGVVLRVGCTSGLTLPLEVVDILD